MPTPGEIIKNAKAHLRDIAGDAVEILKKSIDKTPEKLEELHQKKAEMYKVKDIAKKTHREAVLSQIKGVENAVKSQKEVESISINNPEAITGDLKVGLQGIIETLKDELKNFDKNIVVKNDFSNFASLFKSSQDKTSVINALKKIEDKLGEEKEDTDYTMILSDIAKAVEDKEAVKILQDIFKKELSIKFPDVYPIDLDPNLIENDRVKVVLRKDQVARLNTTASANNSALIENSNSGDNKTQIVDDAGNSIGSSQDANGDYHLDTALIQKIISSANNSTTTNLASGATFTGTAEETFGINGIQLYSFVDQDVTIYIDQSLDATNWDVVDSFTCLANVACTRTFASVAPYYRARLTNDGDSTTTDVRFATGMTPVISTLPRALTEDDRLKSESTLTGKENDERHVWVTPTNALSVESPVRLVGTNFDGQTKDPNFWTEAVTGSGTVTQDGEIQLDTGTTADSTASYTSVRKARFVVGSALKFQGLYKFVTAGTTDNIRRAGAYLATDGFFFQLDGITFSVGWRKNSTDTLVSSGSFNGNIGPNFTPLNTQYYKFEIEWSPKGVFFYVDGKLLHKNGSGHLSDILTLPIAFENINDNGNTTDIAFDCLGVAIMRLGNLTTNATYKYISGATTTVLKYGAGTLHTIVNNDNSGSMIVYDNTAGSGNIIASVDLAKVLGTLIFDAPFSDGLTIVTTGGGVKITVTYE